MLKYYDCKCKKCGYEMEQLKTEKEKFKKCPKCKGKMKRIFTKFNFKLVFNNKKDMVGWGDSGYESSRYWKDVKDARDRGEDVKGINED